MKNVLIFCLAVSFISATGCKKEEQDPFSVPPSNLQINAVVSTDGSGTVNFTAKADNAVSYDFEFGNGDIATIPSGIAEYRYSLAGTNTYTVKVTAKSIGRQTLSKSIDVTVNVTVTGPQLVWSDEFNVDGLPNPSKWGYDIGTGNNGWGNSELQYYTSRADNAVVIDGVLRITARKENYSGSNYTSARLLTKDKYSFKYGRVEARAKLPAGGGTWPAIWMLGSNINTVGWPACGEIDIMEHKGNDLNRIFGTLHYPGRSGGNADGNTRVISNATTEFHNYSVEWSPASIQFFVDGQLVHSFVNSQAVPFNHNFFLIMNVAMGGTFGGSVDPAFNSASMEVDYIRVYQ